MTWPDDGYGGGGGERGVAAALDGLLAWQSAMR